MEEIKKLKMNLDQHNKFVENMVDQVDANKEGVNLILKANDYGTLETLCSQVNKLAEKYPGVNFNLVGQSVGSVTISDIQSAQIFNAIILGMETDINPTEEKMAKSQKITIKNHRIIYSLIDDVKALLEEAKTEKTVET